MWKVQIEIMRVLWLRPQAQDVWAIIILQWMSYGTRLVHCVQHRETHSSLRLPAYEHCLSSQLSWKVGIEAKTWHATGSEGMNSGCWEKILSRGKNGFWSLQLTGLIDQKQSVVQTTDTFENKNPKSHNGLYWICNMHKLILGKLRDMETVNLKNGHLLSQKQIISEH